MKKCKQCGAELKDDAKFCPACGAKVLGAGHIGTYITDVAFF